MTLHFNISPLTRWERVRERGGFYIILAILIVSNFLLSPSLSFSFTLHGFIEGAYGTRFENDLTKKDTYNIAETRLQLKGNYSPDLMEDWEPEFAFKGDLTYDGYEESARADLREFTLSATPHDIVDIKMGRQTLTWGTGDLLFINDLFPKDYVSFFIGRDDEYLKLPSNAFKGSFFLDSMNADLIVMPFEANNSITGDRLSYFHGLDGRIVGEDVANEYDDPDVDAANLETAIRVYKNMGGLEAALYYFDGFYKDPLGVSSPMNYTFFYPELTVWGLSVRDAFAGGIGNLEAGYYDSKEDSNGDNPMIENSSAKFMAGYEKDMGSDFKAGIQFQLEHMIDYDNFIASGGPKSRDEDRHLWTLRLSKLAMNQNMRLGFFAFYSPTDKDYHLRPRVNYKFTDNISATIGGNIFAGEEDYTFFGQLDRNDNAYLRVRYSF